MSGRRRRHPQEKDLTGRLLHGDLDEDRVETHQRFSRRFAQARQSKTERTALLRLAEEAPGAGAESLPTGQVVQTHGLYYDVEHQSQIRLCVVRKTLNALLETAIITGDFVRFRETGLTDERGRPAAVIEQLLPRHSVLTRADSFKASEQHPIVANAGQMLIVASVLEPPVKWGLVDRMIVAARSGHLEPVLCLNKIDLASREAPAGRAMDEARYILDHYRSLGIASIMTSAPTNVGLDELRAALAGKSTVLAGHSGVGKSSLIRAIQPQLDIRVGAISGYTGKGRHTTTSSRRYDLDFSGSVFDTPGVKLFGLWGVGRENLLEFFPDVRDGSAPEFRRESYERLLESLPE